MYHNHHLDRFLWGYAVFCLIVVQLTTWSYGIHTGPLIRDLIKRGPNSRIQGVYLTEYAPEYSVVLNLRNNTDTADERNEEIEEGEFFVRAPNNYGLVVVVQYLQLRLKYVGLSKESLQPMCRDYLQFSDTRGQESPEVCGELRYNDRTKAPERLLGKRTFYSSFGEVNVKLHIDKSEKDEYTRQLWNMIQISVTAVTDCKEDPKADTVPATRACYSNRTLDNTAPLKCIASNLFCDGIWNCGIDEDYIGSDESNCTDPNTLKVPLGAADGGGTSTTMILFVVFGILIVIIFVAVYFITELNLSLRCLPGSRFHNSTSNVQVNKETDQISTPTGTPPSYSNFTIEEPRQR